MVAMRGTALNSGDVRDRTQNSFALLACVSDQLVPIRILNDSVRWTRFELVLDQDAIGQTGPIGKNTTPSSHCPVALDDVWANRSEPVPRSLSSFRVVGAGDPRILGGLRFMGSWYGWNEKSR